MIDMLMCFIKSAKLTPKNAAKANPESDTIGGLYLLLNCARYSK